MKPGCLPDVWRQKTLPGPATTGDNPGVKITVREGTLRGERVWIVDRHTAAGRKRSYHHTRRAADTAASEARASLRTPWQELSDGVKADLAELHAEAERLGTPLRTILSEWKAGRRIKLVESISLAEAIRGCIEHRRASNCRRSYVENLRQCLEAFARGRETMPVSAITAQDVEEWLKPKSKTAWSRSGWRSRLSTLFGWCVLRRHLERNPVDEVPSVRIDHQPPRILTVDECRRLLALTREHHPQGLAWVVLGLFAGIRPGELDRLWWRSVRIARGIVLIDAEASKVRQRRIVPLEPVCVAWLRSCRGSRLPIPHSTRRRMVRDLAKRMGWESWPADILRHTAASYLIAHHQDAGKVALWLGNSAPILMRHYREIVSRQAAEEWVGLGPGG